MNTLSDILFALFMWGMGIATGLIFSCQPVSAPHRAEAQVVYDSGTGCQYLSYHSGGLIPRLNANGQPVCRHE